MIQKRKISSTQWLPISVGMGAVIATLILWQALTVNEEVQMRHIPGGVAHKTSILPDVVLASGLFTSVLLVLVLMFAQRSAQQAIKLKVVNRSLSEEVMARVQAQGDLKMRAEDLERINVELTVANEELEAFAYSVSHDLRTPLRGIAGFAQALEEDCGADLDMQGKHYICRIKAGAERMGHLIDDLLQLSQVTRREMVPESVDLNQLARDVFASLKRKEPNRRVEVTIEDGLSVLGDVGLLWVVLENLLGNAWKFTAEKQDARIEFGQVHNGVKKAFFVRDNGAGFDMAFADKLFQAFQRLHRPEEFPGSGIGLATVQRVVQRHGGKVWAEGEIGVGATFYFQL